MTQEAPRGAPEWIDPVCGKPVTGKEFRVELGTETHYFCSRACLETFRQDPDRYLEDEEGPDRR
jgi:YHS domain-containing protein